jgi:KaiC/GvpD/RAD55 family RecA-like ATPase
MAKKIGLKQLAQKKYVIIDGLDDGLKASLGELEDAFDMIIYGASGNGKSNFTSKVVIALCKALKCRCEYVAYEEGHGKTVQDTMIGRHNMLEELGNAVILVDHYTFEELDREMSKKKSAKIWVIDSIQASHLTTDQIEDLKRKHVLSRRRKILIFISWSEGKLPLGSTAKAVEYNANIKVRVSGFMCFPKSRYGGNKPFVIWEEGARRVHGAKEYKKLLAQ